MTKVGDELTRIKDLKAENLSKMKDCLFDGNIWTKNDLAKRTQLSLGATTNMLQYLLEQQAILYVGEANSTGGRKSKQYQLNPDFRHLLCIILKKRHHQEGIMIKRLDFCGCILEESEHFKETYTPDDLILDIQKYAQQDNLLSYVSLSVPGVCEKGLIDFCDLDAFKHLDLKTFVQERSPLTMLMENDVNLACLGFSIDYPKARHMAFVYQPKTDYVGCGFMVNRKIYQGFSHFAGELRFLPFYNHQMQEEMLRENPLLLLERQVETLCCVFNPEYLGIYSEVLPHQTSLHFDTIPLKHQPHICFIDDLEAMIFKGLYEIILDDLKGA